MPTNLNALVRYKTIDSCLRNNTVSWTIERLQEACTEATGEFRGVYKEISERTIRDDIRIMRSEILGFNAPIACEDGSYKYSDPGYSIFDVPIKTKEVIQRTIAFLEDYFDSIESEEKHDILKQLRELAHIKAVAESHDSGVMFQLRDAVQKTDQGKDEEKSKSEKNDIAETPEEANINWDYIYRLFFN